MNGNQLRGVALRGGTYTDLTGIVPLTSSPTTETSTAHLSYNTDVFYPTQTWVSNYYDALAGGKTRLIVFPAQFQSSAPAAIDGILRKFNQLDLQLYYLPDNWAASGSPAATKSAAVVPAVTWVIRRRGGSAITSVSTPRPMVRWHGRGILYNGKTSKELSRSGRLGSGSTRRGSPLWEGISS